MQLAARLHNNTASLAAARKKAVIAVMAEGGSCSESSDRRRARISWAGDPNATLALVPGTFLH